MSLPADEPTGPGSRRTAIFRSKEGGSEPSTLLKRGESFQELLGR